MTTFISFHLKKSDNFNQLSLSINMSDRFGIDNLMDSNAEDTNDGESVESSEAGLDYSNQNLDQDLLSMVKNISNQIEKAPTNTVTVSFVRFFDKN